MSITYVPFVSLKLMPFIPYISGIKQYLSFGKQFLKLLWVVEFSEGAVFQDIMVGLEDAEASTGAWGQGER